jgi:predicted nucleic acid-binding Zn ribbon protein
VPFHALKGVLTTVLKGYHLEADLEAYRIFHLWEEIAGDRLAQHAQPVRITGSILYVEVDDPLWLTQLRYMKADILAKIDSRIQKGIFKDVRFFLKNAS